MIIAYDSLTGQTRRFVEKLNMKMISVDDYYGSSEKVFLVTRSFNFGEIPKPTLEFLDDYKDDVIGVAVSGNRNWGTNYGKAGDKIEKIYKIPLVLKFEGSGFDKDILYVKEWLEKYEKEGK